MSVEGYPLLPEIVAGWMSLGWTKRAAVQAITDLHFRKNQARGHGNRAARFAKKLRRVILPNNDRARVACDSSAQKTFMARMQNQAHRRDEGVNYQCGPSTSQELKDFDRRDSSAGCNL